MTQRTVALTARVLSTTALSAALLLAGVSVAAAGESDAPPPYQVTETGLALPDGATFPRHGHVNVRWTSASGDGSRNMHLGGPDSPWHDVEGSSTVTWARLGLPADACIVWVQVHGYDEHFGEGGQAPVCRTAPPSEPADVPVPPADDVPPAPTPETPTEPEAPQPPAELDEPRAPAPVPGDEAAPPAEPAPATAPAPASDAPTAGAPAAPVTAAAVAEQAPSLAATGSSTSPLAGAAAAAALLGAALLLTRHTLTRTLGRPVATARGTVD